MPLSELQAEITNWGQETFEEPHPLALGIRGNKEYSELLSDLYNNFNNYDPKKVGEECADVMFFLLQICGLLEVDLEQAVRDKFEVNKKRSWEIAKDGSFQHKEEWPQVNLGHFEGES
jgi:NTP pyrophosphatase (non-canonical NTP hydrolase)